MPKVAYFDFYGGGPEFHAPLLERINSIKGTHQVEKPSKLARHDPALVRAIEELYPISDEQEHDWCVYDLGRTYFYAIFEYDGRESVLTPLNIDWQDSGTLVKSEPSILSIKAENQIIEYQKQKEFAKLQCHNFINEYCELVLHASYEYGSSDQNINYIRSSYLELKQLGPEEAVKIWPEYAYYIPDTIVRHDPCLVNIVRNSRPCDLRGYQIALIPAGSLYSFWNDDGRQTVITPSNIEWINASTISINA